MKKVNKEKIKIIFNKYPKLYFDDEKPGLYSCDMMQYDKTQRIVILDYFKNHFHVTGCSNNVIYFREKV